jgi:hypothetical protein
MKCSFLQQPVDSTPPRLLRPEQAAQILRRSCRTIRYHVKRGTLRRIKKLIREDDLYRLKDKLDSHRWYVPSVKGGAE